MNEETISRILKEYQDNITNTQLLVSEIMKGLESGTPLDELMIKAMDALAKLTGNSVLYTEGKRRIEQNYKNIV